MTSSLNGDLDLLAEKFINGPPAGTDAIGAVSVFKQSPSIALLSQFPLSLSEALASMGKAIDDAADSAVAAAAYLRLLEFSEWLHLAVCRLSPENARFPSAVAVSNAIRNAAMGRTDATHTVHALNVPNDDAANAVDTLQSELSALFASWRVGIVRDLESRLLNASENDEGQVRDLFRILSTIERRDRAVEIFIRYKVARTKAALGSDSNGDRIAYDVNATRLEIEHFFHHSLKGLSFDVSVLNDIYSASDELSISERRSSMRAVLSRLHLAAMMRRAGVVLQTMGLDAQRNKIAFLLHFQHSIQRLRDLAAHIDGLLLVHFPASAPLLCDPAAFDRPPLHLYGVLMFSSVFSISNFHDALYSSLEWCSAQLSKADNFHQLHYDRRTRRRITLQKKLPFFANEKQELFIENVYEKMSLIPNEVFMQDNYNVNVDDLIGAMDGSGAVGHEVTKSAEAFDDRTNDASLLDLFSGREAKEASDGHGAPNKPLSIHGQEKEYEKTKEWKMVDLNAVELRVSRLLDRHSGDAEAVEAALLVDSDDDGPPVAFLHFKLRFMSDEASSMPPQVAASLFSLIATCLPLTSVVDQYVAAISESLASPQWTPDDADTDDSKRSLPSRDTEVMLEFFPRYFSLFRSLVLRYIASLRLRFAMATQTPFSFPAHHALRVFSTMVYLKRFILHCQTTFFQAFTALTPHFAHQLEHLHSILNGLADPPAQPVDAAPAAAQQAEASAASAGNDAETRRGSKKSKLPPLDLGSGGGGGRTARRRTNERRGSESARKLKSDGDDGKLEALSRHRDKGRTVMSFLLHEIDSFLSTFLGSLSSSLSYQSHHSLSLAYLVFPELEGSWEKQRDLPAILLEKYQIVRPSAPISAAFLTWAQQRTHFSALLPAAVAAPFFLAAFSQSFGAFFTSIYFNFQCSLLPAPHANNEVPEGARAPLRVSRFHFPKLRIDLAACVVWLRWMILGHSRNTNEGTATAATRAAAAAMPALPAAAATRPDSDDISALVGEWFSTSGHRADLAALSVQTVLLLATFSLSSAQLIAALKYLQTQVNDGGAAPNNSDAVSRRGVVSASGFSADDEKRRKEDRDGALVFLEHTLGSVWTPRIHRSTNPFALIGGFHSVVEQFCAKDKKAPFPWLEIWRVAIKSALSAVGDTALAPAAAAPAAAAQPSAMSALVTLNGSWLEWYLGMVCQHHLFRDGDYPALSEQQQKDVEEAKALITALQMKA